MALRARGKQIINSIASVSTAKLPLYKKLWENPNPTSAFAAQTITLLSDDYDFLMVVYETSLNGTTDVNISTKGNSIQLSSSGATAPIYRIMDYVSVTSYSVGASYYGGTESDIYNVPLVIYGFKKDVDISSVIASVSTEASKCMMSDGVTNVEDKFTLQTSQATAESGYSLVVNKLHKRAGMCEAMLTLSNFTDAGGSWVKFATVPIKPIDNDCTSTAFNGNNGGFLGEARIDTSGNVYVLPQSSVSGIYVTMRFVYFTND